MSILEQWHRFAKTINICSALKVFGVKAKIEENKFVVEIKQAEWWLLRVVKEFAGLTNFFGSIVVRCEEVITGRHICAPKDWDDDAVREAAEKLRNAEWEYHEFGEKLVVSVAKVDGKPVLMRISDYRGEFGVSTSIGAWGNGLPYGWDLDGFVIGPPEYVEAEMMTIGGEDTTALVEHSTMAAVCAARIFEKLLKSLSLSGRAEWKPEYGATAHAVIDADTISYEALSWLDDIFCAMGAIVIIRSSKSDKLEIVFR